MSKGGGGTRNGRSQTDRSLYGMASAIDEVPENALKIMDIINKEGEFSFTKYGDLTMNAHARSYNDTPVTPKQEEAIDYYQREGYLRMYRFLTTGVGSEKTREAIMTMDKAFKPAEHSIIVYRTESPHTTISPSYVSTTAWVEQSAVYKFKEGSKVHVYKIPKGTPIIQRFAEQEVILPRNTDMRKYRIK